MTLVSTGTRSAFLGPTDALHGDIGILGPDDILVMFRRACLLRFKHALLTAFCGSPRRPALACRPFPLHYICLPASFLPLCTYPLAVSAGKQQERRDGGAPKAHPVRPRQGGAPDRRLVRRGVKAGQGAIEKGRQ